MIPERFRALFWDVNIETFDPHQYPEYTIFRILEFGDRPEIAWLRENFSEEQIKNVIRRNGGLPRGRRTFGRSSMASRLKKSPRCANNDFVSFVVRTHARSARLAPPRSR